MPMDTVMPLSRSPLRVSRSTIPAATVPLVSGSVATFWHQLEEALEDLSLGCSIVPTPNEVPDAVAFPTDTTHRDYDPQAALTFWRQIVSMEPAFALWRSGFIGKDSPVQVFWGSLDLSCVRFSGRLAPPYEGSGPPSCPPWVMAMRRALASSGPTTCGWTTASSPAS